MFSIKLVRVHEDEGESRGYEDGGESRGYEEEEGEEREVRNIKQYIYIHFMSWKKWVFELFLFSFCEEIEM